MHSASHFFGTKVLLKHGPSLLRKQVFHVKVEGLLRCQLEEVLISIRILGPVVRKRHINLIYTYVMLCVEE